MGMAEWGYSVLEGSPSEQFTTSGAEASVKYIGPSLYRVPFIKEVFGAWHIDSTTVNLAPEGASENLKTYKCAIMSPEVTAYPYMTVLDDEAQCTGEVCLWPDTFSGQPSGDSKPYLLNCGAGSDLGYPILDQCAWEYTVNYRYKNNGSLPDILNPDTTINPTVPFGTYTECRITTSNEFMTTPGRFSSYNPNALKDTTSPEWQFQEACRDKKQFLKIDDDGFASQLVTTTNIEVVWSNVPLPPWDIIRRASGCVNSHAMFGFPAGAVLFEFAEPEITGYFGCMEVYRLRYVFKVKTAAVVVSDKERFTFRDEILDGQIGIWNRRFSPCPITRTIEIEGPDFYSQCTHWVPVVSVVNNTLGQVIVDPNPPNPPGEDDQDCDTGTGLPFRRFPLQLLFAMNVCDCDPSNPACTEVFGAVHVTDPSDTSKKFIIHGVSLATYSALPDSGSGFAHQFHPYSAPA